MYCRSSVRCSIEIEFRKIIVCLFFCLLQNIIVIIIFRLLNSQTHHTSHDWRDSIVQKHLIIERDVTNQQKKLNISGDLEQNKTKMLCENVNKIHLKWGKTRNKFHNLYQIINMIVVVLCVYILGWHLCNL